MSVRTVFLFRYKQDSVAAIDICGNSFDALAMLDFSAVHAYS